MLFSPNRFPLDLLKYRTNAEQAADKENMGRESEAITAWHAKRRKGEDPGVYHPPPKIRPEEDEKLIKVPEYSRRIEFIGDSLQSGYGATYEAFSGVSFDCTFRLDQASQ